MKKLTGMLLALALVFSASACDGRSAYYGTWKAVGAQIDDSNFTLEELEEMGVLGVSGVSLTMAENSKAYLHSGGEDKILDWSVTPGGVQVGGREYAFADGLICMDCGDLIIYMEKASEHQALLRASARVPPDFSGS